MPKTPSMGMQYKHKIVAVAAGDGQLFRVKLFSTNNWGWSFVCHLTTTPPRDFHVVNLLQR